MAAPRVLLHSPAMRSVWAQYTALLDDRDAVKNSLAEAGVPSAIYYSRPLHRQTAYCDYPQAPSCLAVSEEICDRVLSLPMHPYLDQATQDKIVGVVHGAVGGQCRIPQVCPTS